METFESLIHVLRRWLRFSALRTCVAMGSMLAGSLAWAQSVVFINPGKTDEAYWVAAGDAMKKAAQSLGMDLKMIHTERDRLRPIEVAKEIAQLPKSQRPDYLVFSNEYSVAPSILRVLEGSGIKVFMAYSGLQGELRTQLGKPREKFPLWLGSMDSNAFDGGYLTAKELIDVARLSGVAKGPAGKMHMVAIPGDRSTPSSVARNEGMRRAVREAPDVVLEQEVYGEWRRDKAQEQAAVLYQRYPHARLVWAGNDLMAFGAMHAWEKAGGTPGKDAFFSGINTSNEAFAALRQDRLSALAGGHFMVGAWVMVMLFDHSKGIDFANEGVERQLNTFILFNADSAQQFQESFNNNAYQLDFKAFSKFHHPNLKRYDFDLNRLLR